MKRKLWLLAVLVLCLVLAVGILAACNFGSSGQGDDTTPDDAVRRTVSFDLNGADGSISPMEFAVGYAMSDLPEPSRRGYNFIGWRDINGDPYDENSIMPDTDFTLYAQWEVIVSSYEDTYVSFKPAASGVKDSDTKNEYPLIDTFLYVEITSSDLGGRSEVGNLYNFDFSKGVNIEYAAKDGYTLQWYNDEFFSELNGAQVFTLYYGSNFQFLTVSSGQSVVRRYLVDFYVLHDYRVNLYTNIYAESAYDSVYVVENRTLSSNIEASQLKDFEFDKRVYWNETADEWRGFNYSTAITKDMDLYQTYKPKAITAELDGGTLDEELAVKPYTEYQQLPVPTKEGYDFIGWQLPWAEDEYTDYFADITGFNATRLLGAGGGVMNDVYFESLKAVWMPKKIAQVNDGDTVSFTATVPVVTYTDASLSTINEIIYVAYGTDCVVPENIVYDGNFEFRGWKAYTEEDKTGNDEIITDGEPQTPGGVIDPDDPVIDPDDPVDPDLPTDPDIPTDPKPPTDPSDPVDPGTTPSQPSSERVALDSDRFDFNVKVTEPISLYQSMNTATVSVARLYLNGTREFSSDYNVRRIRMMLPAHGTYVFTVTSDNLVQLEYDGDTYFATSSSPATISIRNSYSDYGLAVFFDVTTYTGNFSISVSGPTANTDGNPVDLDVSKLHAAGDEVTLTASKTGYVCVGWYEGDTLVSEDGEYTFTLAGDQSFTPVFERDYSAIESFAEEYTVDEAGNVTISKVSFDATIIVIPDYGIFDSGAFSGALNLNGIYISGSNQNYSALSGILYNHDMTEIIHVPFNIRGSVRLSDCLTAIDNNEFSGRRYLTSVVIPDSVQSIGDRAFNACTGLTEVTIGNGVTSIGEKAFYQCGNLVSLTIGNKVTSIGRNAFARCYNLLSVTIPNSVTNIEAYAFDGCSKLTSVNYDGTIEEWSDIRTWLFWNRNCPFTEVVCSDGTVKYK